MQTDPDTFWLREHAASLRYPPKTFEEAVFLSRLRNMLVSEDENALWLAKGTPRAWLEQGREIAIENAPTFFGTVSYTSAFPWTRSGRSGRLRRDLNP